MPGCCSCSLEASPFALPFPFLACVFLRGLEGGVGTVGVCCLLAGLLPQDIRNTVGNVPLEWYDDFPHVGYDLDGRRIYKPLRTRDELDQFLDKMDDPDYWWVGVGRSLRVGGVGLRGGARAWALHWIPPGAPCGTG